MLFWVSCRIGLDPGLGRDVIVDMLWGRGVRDVNLGWGGL